MVTPQPIIHINGYPGVGKLTIATALEKLMPGSKVIHNHMLINPVDAVLSRSDRGYQELRRSIRKAIFEPIADNEATFKTTFIFTDFQSTDAIGSGVCKEYETLARDRGCMFLPIVLTCDEDVNLQRLISEDRAEHKKLTDVELVRDFRRKSEIYSFSGNDAALKLDVTYSTAEEAAQEIRHHCELKILEAALKLCEKCA